MVRPPAVPGAGGRARVALRAAQVGERIDVLAREHPRPAEVIQYRYILGLTAEETAKTLEVSERTVRGDAKLALAWLKRELGDGASGS